MTDRSIRINRAPVLTLWAAVVAERLGFDHDEALTLGKALAGLNAFSKGKSLGLFQPSEETLQHKRQQKDDRTRFNIELMHRAIPAVVTPDGIRALARDKPVTPQSVERYLASKFGEDLEPFTKAMATLALSFPPQELTAKAFSLYEMFRPDIPRGVEGWGAKGELSITSIQKLSGDA
jgi:hypothetical protein